MPKTVESPSPVPLPWLLGREERLEDAGLRLRVHARAGVGDREHHVRPRRARRDGRLA